MRGSYLVTGATGFIGMHLVELLLDAGKKVRILARDSGKVPARWQGRVEVVEGDITAASSLKEATRGCEKVYHLAGAINLPTGREADFYKINLEGTKNILNSALDGSPAIKRFLYCSSVGVFGPLRSIPANEETPCRPYNAYEKSKYEAEKWVLQTGLQKGVPVSVVRPAWVYGPGDKRTFPIFSMIAKKRFIMIGRGETWIHPIFVGDLVKGMVQCSQSPLAVGKIVILAGGQPIKLKNLAHLLSEMLGVGLWPVHVPLGAAKLVAMILEVLYKPMRKMPPLHRRRLGFFMNDQAFNTAFAKTCCGFSPKTGLEEGIRLTIDWYKEHGWI